MSVLYSYIATKSTVDPYIPAASTNMAIFTRNVSDGFLALSGGRTTVGQIAHFPVQRSVPNHLLCDGRAVAKASFPELFDYLGTSQGTPADATLFTLPNYIGAGSIVEPTVAQTATESAVEGTVSSPDPTPPAPTDPPETYPTYGDVDSGGRFRRVGEQTGI